MALFVYTKIRKTMNRAGRQRLNIDLPEAIYKRIKKAAMKRNITLTKLVIRSILIQLIVEEKYEKSQED